MRRTSKFLASSLALTVLAACGGSLGSSTGIGGAGLSGPVAPNVAAGGYLAPTPLPREYTTEDKLPYVPSTGTIVLPPVKGFSISIDLNAPVATPAPPSTPTVAASGPPAAAPNAKTPFAAGHGAPPPPPLPGPTPAPPSGRSGFVPGSRGGVVRTLAIEGALVAALPSALASAAADAAVSPGPLSSPASDASAAASAAAVPSGSAPPVSVSAAASPLPAGTGAAAVPGASARPATPRPHPTHRPLATPTPAGPVVDAKTIIYPDYAPKPPDPKIKGAISRVPLLRGYVIFPADITLGSLAAVKFVIPQNEITPGRGYTIAVFDEKKKKKPHLLVADTNVIPVQTTFTGTSDDVVELHKGDPYSFVLFADALPPSPPPAGSYQAPGAVPGVPGVPGQPGATGLPGQPGQPLATAQPGYPQVPGAPAGNNQPYGTVTPAPTLPPNYPTFPPA